MLDRLDSKIEFDTMKRFIGYRFEATGIFGYRYYSASSSVCSVSSIVAPSAPVMIHGNGVTWRSDFENCTIVPGLTRSIIDESNGRQLFRIVYKDFGEYEINKSIIVYCDRGKYTFCRDDKVVATINRFSGKPDSFVKPSDDSFDYEPYFEAAADNRTDAELFLVMLAFPMLQFAY